MDLAQPSFDKYLPQVCAVESMERTGVWDSVEKFEKATRKELQGLIPLQFSQQTVTSKEDVLRLWEIDEAY